MFICFIKFVCKQSQPTACLNLIHDKFLEYIQSFYMLILINNIAKKMNIFKKLFQSQYQQYLDEDCSIQLDHYPSKLLEQLDPQSKNSKFQEFLNKIRCPQNKSNWKIWNSPSKKTQKKDHQLTTCIDIVHYNLDNPEEHMLDGIYLLRILSLLSYLLLYSNKYYTIIPEILPLHNKCSQNDKWLIKNFLKPYQKYLLKCCSSSDQYQKFRIEILKGVDPSHLKQQFTKKQIINRELISYESIFYLVNLLQCLFQSMNNVSSLGRYFVGNTTNMFVFLGAVHSVRIYLCLKLIITEMVRMPQVYVKLETEPIMKSILESTIPQLNQKMKLLLLNKYFTPYQQGIKTRLFRNEQMSHRTSNYIKNITITQKQKNKNQKVQQFRKVLIQATENLVKQDIYVDQFENSPQALETNLVEESLCGIYLKGILFSNTQSNFIINNYHSQTFNNQHDSNSFNISIHKSKYPSVDKMVNLDSPTKFQKITTKKTVSSEQKRNKEDKHHFSFKLSYHQINDITEQQQRKQSQYKNEIKQYFDH